MIGSEGVIGKEKIAYFSMEIGLASGMHTYSGGLGVLAGDTIRASADLNVPLVAVTLISKKGNFRQELDAQGRQTEHSDDWDPLKFMMPLTTDITVRIEDRDLKIRPWLYNYQSLIGVTIPIIFLDTDVEGNAPQDREITDHLYGKDESYRLKQEIVLGIGGIRMLDALGYRVRKYHMNEGHSSLMTLELLRKYEMDVEKVRDMCIFTTHTPVEAGHDKFAYNLVEKLMDGKTDIEVLKRFGGSDRLNMTLLALNLSRYVNGVTKRHREISSKLFPGYHIHSVTNGVHSYNWTSPPFRKLYDRYIPGWAKDPELLVRVDGIPDEEIWQAHRESKKSLIDYVNSKTGVGMDYETLTIGFARRATEYKRTTLLFSDLNRLRKLNRKGKVQLIFAGKAHPKDPQGKKLIEEVFGYIKELKSEIKIAYLENYNMDIASKMVSGVDVWLNTPQRPFEASGTSGMKAAHNGVVNFSVLDGWWIEGWIEGVNGWSIGPEPEEVLSPQESRTRELDDLYSKLEYIIVPMYYKRKDEWTEMMNNSIGTIAYYFNSHSMMRRYVTEAYL